MIIVLLNLVTEIYYTVIIHNHPAFVLGAVCCLPYEVVCHFLDYWPDNYCLMRRFELCCYLEPTDQTSEEASECVLLYYTHVSRLQFNAAS